MARAAPTRLTVDLAAMAANYRMLAGMTRAKVAGVIKANAYGIGAREAFRTLRGQGCDAFFVATLEEGIALRGHAGGEKRVSILVLCGILPGAQKEYAHHGLTPVLNSGEDVERWKTIPRQSPAVLHVDTGMNRLGLSIKQAEALAGTLDIGMVMSHFACSDEPNHPMNARQAMDFAKIAQHLPAARKSLCNSSAIFREKAWHHDMVRPGYALYGGNPVPESPNPMKPVVTLEAQILQIRDVKKGESAGYGAAHVFEKDTRIATIGIGYADGFLRSGSGRARVFWQGHPCPVAGRISMDLTIIDIGNLLENPPNPGDWVEVIGPSQDIDALAGSMGTSGYEILTSLGPRHERIYLEEAGS